MSEFNIRAESVDVEQIMNQIRSRIREKRGVDYTEAQIREMAAVKLERFLDPKNVRSDLAEHYRRIRGDVGHTVASVRREPPPPPPSFEFDPDIIYRSSRGLTGKVLYGIRRLLNPILKLFFNPTPIVHALHVQREQIDYIVETHMDLMDRFDQIATKLAARAELDALTYELLNNLVVEMTRLSIDMKNHRMRVESIAGRLDFDERRARSLESIVQPRPGTDAATGTPATDDTPGGPERKRRRRRRGRRRSGTGGDAAAAPDANTTAAEGDGAESTAAPREHRWPPTAAEVTPADPTTAASGAEPVASPAGEPTVASATPSERPPAPPPAPDAPREGTSDGGTPGTPPAADDPSTSEP